VGLDALAAAVRRSGARTADQIRVAAESLLHGESSRADDVCLLAARLLASRADQRFAELRAIEQRKEGLRRAFQVIEHRHVGMQCPVLD
jgi:hypothetical protein